MQPQNRSWAAWCSLQGQLAGVCGAPPLGVKGGAVGPTRAFLTAYTQVLHPREVQGS